MKHCKGCKAPCEYAGTRNIVTDCEKYKEIRTATLEVKHALLFPERILVQDKDNEYLQREYLLTQ